VQNVGIDSLWRRAQYLPYYKNIYFPRYLWMGTLFSYAYKHYWWRVTKRHFPAHSCSLELQEVGNKFSLRFDDIEIISATRLLC
jgi:hypothetical protein